MDIIFALVLGFWIVIPAYAANGFAPFARGKRRIDFGLNFFDGKPIFGPGKTWEGLIFAVFMGTLFGAVEIYFYPQLNAIALENGLALFELSIFSVFLVALGAMLGDMLGSFIKRRMGISRGRSAPLLDQLDFLFGAFVFAYVFFEISFMSVLLYLMITPFVHLTCCFIGNKLGVKKEPW